MQRTFNVLFLISTLIMTTEKKSRNSAFGHAYEGISDILRRKGGHIGKHLCRKSVNQGERTVLGGDVLLRNDQVEIPKDICKVLTKLMVVNSLNYGLAKKLIAVKKVNYVQKR